ncbi:MAG: hypothetical protein M3R17_11490 [Bacteroidota bacterium]|nr:hypothetical protein [Bacteroidota bacterium]
MKGGQLFMMRSLLTCIVCLFLLRASGQVNLVFNPSFEDTVPCSGGYPYDPETPANGWMALGSVDYFSDFYCGGIVTTSNPFGFQSPYDGNGYFGFSAYYQPFNSDAREYLFTDLIQPLQAGKKYCISFYVSLADSMDLGIKNIAMLFSQDSIPFNGPNIMQYMLSQVPQFESTVIVTDKVGWVKISGEYYANGTERYITIGNFRPYNATTFQVVNPPAWPWSGSYYFIDMVSVTEAPSINAGTDLEITVGDSIQLQAMGGNYYTWSPSTGLSCTTCANPFASPSITTTFTVTVLDTCGCSNLDSVKVVVQPRIPSGLRIPTLLKSGDVFQIDSLAPDTKVSIYDMRGRKLYENDNYSNDFSFAEFSEATYIYEVILTDKRIFKGKICILK